MACAIDEIENKIGKTVAVCLCVLWIIFDLTFRDAYISAVQCISLSRKHDHFRTEFSFSVILTTV